MSDNTIHLWGQDGAHAGSLTIQPIGCKEATILQLNFTVAGLHNFDFWLAYAQRQAHEVLETQAELAAKETESNDEKSNE